MKKTEGKKTVIVIDKQGNKLDSTYPKRAKGLTKNGRAQVVDENTICLVDLPKHILEEKKMNNNNNLEKRQEARIDLEYIIKKIDEITEMNRDLIINFDHSKIVTVPGAKNSIQCICETNNKMIDFLQGMLDLVIPKKELKINTVVMENLTNVLHKALEENVDAKTIEVLINNLAKYI